MAYKKGTHFFTIPLTPEEWAEIQRRAKAQGRSAANYGRMILLDGKVNSNTRNMDNWIKVEDRLPEKRKAVLVYAPEMNEPITTMCYDPDSDSDEFGEWVSEPSGPSRGGWSSLGAGDVTHWMPLPESPSGN